MHQPSAHDIPPAAEVLARVYIDAVAKSEGVKMKSMLARRHHDSELVDEILADLEPNDAETLPHIRVDLVAAAVLVARAVAGEPGLARRLRQEGPVVIIKTHTSDLVEQVRDIVEDCVITSGSHRRLIISRDGSDRGHNPEKGNRDVVAARNQRWPIVGIAPAPRKQLPASLTCMAQYELSLPAMDDWAVRLILEATTGTKYEGAINAELIRNADVSDMCLSFHRDLTPEQCLERLADLVSKKQQLDIDGPRLEELHGYGEAAQWGLELIADLAEFRAGKLAWSEIDHCGLLLSGPPGVGKTSFARALAKSAGVPLIATSVADWNAASYLSGTLQAIRNVFGQAKRSAPAILFIDELDGISNRATLTGEYVEYWSQIVNLLLECLAGIEDREGVVVLAATNHPQKIDAAILRAGRLDHHIALEKPDLVALAMIFRFHLGEGNLVGVDLMPAALAARGGTGADVEAWVRRSKAAARRARRELTLDDVIGQISGGQTSWPAEVRRRIAIHEAGHILVGRLLGTGRVLGVSLHEQGGSAEFDVAINGAMTRDVLDQHISVALAGRAAEELILGAMSIGAGNGMNSDLARATAMANMLETQYGLGSFGAVFIGDGTPGKLPFNSRLLEAIRKRLEDAQERAMTILKEHQEPLLRLAEELDKRGYLSSSDIEAIIDLASYMPADKAKDAAE